MIEQNIQYYSYDIIIDHRNKQNITKNISCFIFLKFNWISVRISIWNFTKILITSKQLIYGL